MTERRTYVGVRRYRVTRLYDIIKYMYVQFVVLHAYMIGIRMFRNAASLVLNSAVVGL